MKWDEFFIQFKFLINFFNYQAMLCIRSEFAKWSHLEAEYKSAGEVGQREQFDATPELTDTAAQPASGGRVLDRQPCEADQEQLVPEPRVQLQEALIAADRTQKLVVQDRDRQHQQEELSQDKLAEFGRWRLAALQRQSQFVQCAF